MRSERSSSRKGRPYRTVPVEGFEILVGRGDAENDLLTFEVAAPGDLWLHVGGGTPGSHVVIRSPQGSAAPPAAVIRHAAALAVWHSKARGRGRVEVHLCRVADVRKRRGAPPGEVVLRRWERVRVSAAEVEGLWSPAGGGAGEPGSARP